MLHLEPRDRVNRDDIVLLAEGKGGGRRNHSIRLAEHVGVGHTALGVAAEELRC